MSKILPIMTLTLSIVVAGACLGVGVSDYVDAGGPAPDAAQESTGQDEETVRGLAAEFVRVMSLRNAVSFDRLNEILADDFMHVNNTGEYGKGKAACLLIFKKILESIKQHFVYFDQRYEVRSVTVCSDTAVLFGKANMIGHTKESMRPYWQAAWITLVFQKGDAGWQLISETRVSSGKLPGRETAGQDRQQ